MNHVLQNLLPVGNPQRELALRLVRDMQDKGLAPGDRYLTAAEAAVLFEISPATANRAMRLLESQGLLERRPRMGTLVGKAFEPAVDASLKTILILHPEMPGRRSNVNFNELINSASLKFPGASVQIHFLPAVNPLKAVRKVISAALEGGKISGVIAISCNAAVYNFLAGEYVPLVIFGSLYPGQKNMQAVTPDLGRAGELLADHLISRGHSRLALLVHSRGRPGDDQFLNGIMEAMTKHKLQPNALKVQLVSPEADQFKHQVKDLISGLDEPSGIILQSRALAEDFSLALQSTQARNVEIGFYDHATEQVEKSPFAHVQSEMSYEKMAVFLVDRLVEQSKDGSCEKSEIQLPVVLCEGVKQ